MENILISFMAIWNSYGHLVYFVVIGIPFAISYGHLVYCVVIGSIWCCKEGLTSGSIF
jgi:hypothetical protein